MFDRIAKCCTWHRGGIAVEEIFDVRLMADDIAALIDHLGLEKPDMVGYSLGGGVAFFVAVRHPGKVNRLVMAWIRQIR